ncbi:MAG: hypothetical protein ACXVSL_11465 [Solirubrobacteraceae bacterium]
MLSRYLQFHRHTDSDGDVLSEDCVMVAFEIVRRLTGPYALPVSSGAPQATQTLARFVCTLSEPVSCAHTDCRHAIDIGP